MKTTIIFGVLLADGHTDWPGRNQLMLALTEHTPVLLLEESPPSRHLLNWQRPRIENIADNLFVMRAAFALRSRRLGRRLYRISAKVDGRWFRKELNAAGLAEDYVFWLTVNDPVLAHGVPSQRLVYDCMDPNFLPAVQARFDRTEFSIARRACLIFASAQSLFDRMSVLNEATYLLPNATTVPRGVLVGDVSPLLPDGLRGRAGSVVGYMGTIDWRFDTSHVLTAARSLPEVTFAIVGRVNADQEGNLRELRALSNVVFTGPVDREEGDAYTRAFDVGIIPFTQSPMNDAVNPVKMYMYLAQGIPVVSTWITECRNNPFVVAAKDPNEFTAAIRSALEENDPHKALEREKFALDNTWAQRAGQVVDVLSAHGLIQH